MHPVGAEWVGDPNHPTDACATAVPFAGGLGVDSGRMPWAQIRLRRSNIVILSNTPMCPSQVIDAPLSALHIQPTTGRGTAGGAMSP
jgi:hypothetical protein